LAIERTRGHYKECEESMTFPNEDDVNTNTVESEGHFRSWQKSHRVWRFKREEYRHAVHNMTIACWPRSIPAFPDVLCPDPENDDYMGLKYIPDTGMCGHIGIDELDVANNGHTFECIDKAKKRLQDERDLVEPIRTSIADVKAFCDTQKDIKAKAHDEYVAATQTKEHWDKLLGLDFEKCGDKYADMKMACRQWVQAALTGESTYLTCFNLELQNLIKQEEENLALQKAELEAEVNSVQQFRCYLRMIAAAPKLFAKMDFANDFPKMNCEQDPTWTCSLENDDKPCADFVDHKIVLSNECNPWANPPVFAAWFPVSGDIEPDSLWNYYQTYNVTCPTAHPCFFIDKPSPSAYGSFCVDKMDGSWHGQNCKIKPHSITYDAFGNPNPAAEDAPPSECPPETVPGDAEWKGYGLQDQQCQGLPVIEDNGAFPGPEWPANNKFLSIDIEGLTANKNSQNGGIMSCSEVTWKTEVNKVCPHFLNWHKMMFNVEKLQINQTEFFSMNTMTSADSSVFKNHSQQLADGYNGLGINDALQGTTEDTNGVTSHDDTKKMNRNEAWTSGGNNTQSNASKVVYGWNSARQQIETMAGVLRPGVTKNSQCGSGVGETSAFIGRVDDKWGDDATTPSKTKDGGVLCIPLDTSKMGTDQEDQEVEDAVQYCENFCAESTSSVDEYCFAIQYRKPNPTDAAMHCWLLQFRCSDAETGGLATDKLLDVDHYVIKYRGEP